MEKEQIKIGDQMHEIDVRPITIICQSAESAVGPPIRYQNRLALDPTATIYHAERVQKLDPLFAEAWRRFLKATNQKTDNVPTPDEFRQMGTGAIHLMGLIDMTIKLVLRKGVPVAWVHPESYLHPAWQVGLADLAIYFANMRALDLEL